MFCSWFRLFAIFLCFSLHSLFAANSYLSVQIPKTGYIQWFKSSQTTMNSPAETSISLHFHKHKDTEELFLAIMCNSLSGYEITFIATDALGPDSATAISSNNSTIEYTASLVEENGSFKSGTIRNTQLDLTGSRSSVQVWFQTPSSLPMEAHRPNVFKLITQPSTKLQSGTIYIGGITAILHLP